MTTDTLPPEALAAARAVRIAEQQRYINGLKRRLAAAEQQIAHLDAQRRHDAAELARQDCRIVELEAQIAALQPEPVPYPVELAALHISLEATP